ncbi:MAG TPA: hypothetical protein VHC20_06210 [Candidatus Paceibacterota bacterium]|nr:hypothetical protein [Candidatus Paceibacterota bacterium]
MAWSGSSMFREFLRTSMGGAGASNNTLSGSYAGLGADTIKAALFDNTITPTKDAARTASGYGSGVWASGGVSHANWPAAGQTLSSKTLTVPSTGVMRFDAADTAGAGTLTIANAYGALVYDDTTVLTGTDVADQGICFNYFGGAQSVTGGTFTIVWSANGIFEVTAA